MSAKRYDLYVKQGEDATIEIDWYESGAIVDVTGWQGAMQARTEFSSPTTLLSLATADDGFGGSPDQGLSLDDDGHILVSIPAATSSAFPIDPSCPSKTTAGVFWVQLGVYDLELTDTEGTHIRLAGGRLYLSPEVTRP
jgi:hypothetical protein